jgi:hypothetical protein
LSSLIRALVVDEALLRILRVRGGGRTIWRTPMALIPTAGGVLGDPVIFCS